MKFKIRSFLLTTIMLLMGMHFQSNVFAHSDHDKDANVIKIAVSVWTCGCYVLTAGDIIKNHKIDLSLIHI